jgi:hypothetical protein
MLCTWAVYHAVHFKLITNISTNGLMLGLRRFIARQGQPKIVYSESGNNFFGAENLLKSLDWNKFTQEVSILRIHWKYPPPPPSYSCLVGWTVVVSISDGKEIVEKTLRKIFPPV